MSNDYFSEEYISSGSEKDRWKREFNCALAKYVVENGRALSLFSNSRLGREYETSSDYTASEVVSAYDLEVYDCNADSYEDRYSEDDCGFSVRAVYENGNERKVRMEGSISEFLEEIFSA